MRIYRDYGGHGFTFVVGEYVARVYFNLRPNAGFGWLEGASPIRRFVSRFWSGWHHWRDDADSHESDF